MLKKTCYSMSNRVGVIHTVKKKQNYVVTFLVGKLPKGCKTKKLCLVYSGKKPQKPKKRHSWKFLFDRFMYLALSALAEIATIVRSTMFQKWWVYSRRKKWVCSTFTLHPPEIARHWQKPRGNSRVVFPTPSEPQGFLKWLIWITHGFGMCEGNADVWKSTQN